MSSVAEPAPERRVVIVDDHALFAETLEIALRAHAYDVVRVALPDPPSSSGPLLTRALDHAPDLLVLDLDLGPWGDGYPLIEPAVRAGAKVVVVTGAQEPGQWARAVMCGASKVVSKSEPLTAVLETVRGLSQGEEVMSPEERSELLEAWVRRRAGQEALWARFDLLSIRESEVLGLLMQGQSVRDITRRHHTTEATVRTQVKSVLGKLEVSSQLAAVGLAYQLGWRPPFQRPPETDLPQGAAGLSC